MHRRNFIRNTLLAAAGTALAPAMGKAAAGHRKLVILHTNDVHSRLDPFPMDGSRNAGKGGVLARMKLIERIRRENEHVLLFDSGDIFQGTPYFNMYLGEPEIKAMSLMRYDACTIGNHDFDAGMENLATQLTRHANFPMIVSNYDFSETPMENKTIPWKTFQRGDIKVGVLGLGIALRGLVAADLYGKTQYLDPVQKANETANYLKRKESCDLVICLSHLGFKYGESSVISDHLLAGQTTDIDLILGGHTHTFLNKPQERKNQAGSEVLINQVGFGGLVLGRLDLSFDPVQKKKFFNARSLDVKENLSI